MTQSKYYDDLLKNGWIIAGNTPTSTSCVASLPEDIEEEMREASKSGGTLTSALSIILPPREVGVLVSISESVDVVIGQDTEEKPK